MNADIQIAYPRSSVVNLNSRIADSSEYPELVENYIKDKIIFIYYERKYQSPQRR